MQPSTFLVIASLGFIVAIRSQPLLNKTQPTCPQMDMWGTMSPFDGTPNPLTYFTNSMDAMIKKQLPENEKIQKYKTVIEKYCKEGHQSVKNQTDRMYQLWSTCYQNHQHPKYLHVNIFQSLLLNFGCNNQQELFQVIRGMGMECYLKIKTKICGKSTIEETDSSEPYNLCMQLRSSWEKGECGRSELIKCGKFFQDLVNYIAEQLFKCNGTNKENFDRSFFK